MSWYQLPNIEILFFLPIHYSVFSDNEHMTITFLCDGHFNLHMIITFLCDGHFIFHKNLNYKYDWNIKCP